MSSEASSKFNNPRGAFCVMIFSKRKEGISLEEYRYNYENSHMKLIDSIVDGIVKNPPASDPNISSREGLDPVCVRRQYLDPSPNKLFRADQTNSADVEKMNFDCVTTLKFRDEAHATRFVGLVIGNEEHAKRIVADEERFLERKYLRSCIVDEVTGF